MDEQTYDIEDFESISKEVQKILRKNDINDSDFLTLQEYSTQIENNLKAVGRFLIINPSIRKMLFKNVEKISYLDSNYKQLGNNILSYVYKGMTANLVNDMDGLLSEISITEMDTFLEVYFNNDTSFSYYGIEILSLIKSKMEIDEFVKSNALATYSVIAEENWSIFNQNPTAFISFINEILDFAKDYIIDLKSKNIEVDFENDVFLSTFPTERKDELESFYSLISKTHDNPTIEEISYINNEIIEIFERTRERGKKLTNIDQMLLEIYFKSFYAKALSKIEDMPKKDRLDFYKVMNLISRAGVYHFDSTKDNDFFLNIFPDKEDVINAILVQSDLEDEDWTCVAIVDFELEAIKDYNMYAMNKFAEDNSFDFTKQEATKKYMELIIQKVVNGDKVNEDGKYFVIDYINELIIRPNFNIFNEQYICDILQLVRTGRLDSDLSDNIEILLNDKFDTFSIDADKELKTVYSIINANPTRISEDDLNVLIRTFTIIKT